MAINNTNAFPRQLSREALDDLERDDPLAIRARADLQRINWVMGSAPLIMRALSVHMARFPRNLDPGFWRILELGAGDGTLMLRLAKRWDAQWPKVHLTLLDRQDWVSSSTLKEFQRLGWTVDVLCVDIHEWIVAPSDARWDMAVANLFIHHFDSTAITTLFEVLGKRVEWFMACEPRRARLALLASRLVILLGANSVTREDAVLSVQAGFSGNELSALWPYPFSSWEQKECSAGLFSHTFVAYKRAR